MSAALPFAAVGTSLLAARQASAIGSFNQAVAERNATIAEQEAEAQKKLTTYNLNKFNQSFEKLQSRTRVSLLKSGVELSGTALKILQSNAEQAELQRDVIEYNGQVAEAKKLEEANFARISGTLAKRQANLQALGYISQAGTSLLNMKQVGLI
jgi:regulator of protease activity HflC (stomatin/prohibitin superfamily)